MCLMTTAANRIRFSQEPSTGDHVVLVILRNLIQAPHILWHKHFERVEIVGALSGHSIACGGAERHEAAGEFIGFLFAVRNEFLGEYAQLTDECFIEVATKVKVS